MTPIPADLDRYYPKEYYPVPKTLSELRTVSKHERFKLDLVAPHVNSGQLLEIGPAYGNFAFLAKQAGYDVEVVEMDPDCCTFLEETVKVKTIQSDDIVEAVAGKGPYDVVTLWHVIEHLPEFWRTLDSLAERIREKGILVIAAPNPDAFQFSVLGRYWAHVDAPRHLCLIPCDLLVSHMSKLGFTVKARTMTDPGGLGWNLFGWQVSLSNFADQRRIKSGLSLTGSFIARLMRLFENNDRRGAAYTIIFEKNYKA